MLRQAVVQCQEDWKAGYQLILFDEERERDYEVDQKRKDKRRSWASGFLPQDRIEHLRNLQLQNREQARSCATVGPAQRVQHRSGRQALAHAQQDAQG